MDSVEITMETVQFSNWAWINKHINADLQPTSELFQLSLNFFSFHPSTQLHTDIDSLQNQARFVVVAPESAFQAKIHFLMFIFQLQQTGFATLQELRAAEREADVCHWGNGRLWTGVKKTRRSWVQESGGMKKPPPVFKSGSLFRIGRSFWEFVLMHALTCVVLLWEHMLDCCLHVVGFWARALHTAVSAGLCTPDSLEKFLYRFKPKHGRCSHLSECAPLYARWTRPLWHLFNKTTGFLFCAFDSYDHVR